MARLNGSTSSTRTAPDPQRDFHDLPPLAGAELDAGLDHAGRQHQHRQRGRSGPGGGALLSFKGVPLLPIPAFTFSTEQPAQIRLLPPSVGVDNVNGIEVSVPYYWNIAPNRDATLFPAVMSKRGLDLAGEFRYLESGYAGQLRANFMPGDKLRNMNRWGVCATHSGTLDTGISGLGRQWASTCHSTGSATTTTGATSRGSAPG
jgi:hypothetical protein